LPWFKIELTAAKDAKNRQSEVQAQFEAAFLALDAPKEAALFGTTFSGRRCLYLYFSPAVEIYVKSLLNRLGALPSGRPSEKVVLLVGDAGALQRLQKGEI